MLGKRGVTEYGNGPSLGDDETQSEVGQNSNGPELGKETVNVSEPQVEETVNVGEPGLGNEEQYVNDFGLGNENENVFGEKEDSALNVHFGETEDEGVIAGDLDSEVDGNGVNVETETVVDEGSEWVEGEVNNAEKQTEVGEGSVRVEGENNIADRGKKKKRKASSQKKSKTGKRKKSRGRPKKKQPGQDPVFEDDIIDQLQRSVNIESEAGASEAVVGDRGLDELDEVNSDDLNSGSDSDEDGEKRAKFPTFKMPEKMKDYKWEVGTYFVSKLVFMEAMRTYAVHSGRAIKFRKNDKDRVRVKCKEGCPWEAFCGKYLVKRHGS
jgi:hypothetical protein